MTVDLMVDAAKSFLFVLVTLLPIRDPAATAPIFLSMTEGASPATRPFKLMLAKVENYGGGQAIAVGLRHDF